MPTNRLHVVLCLGFLLILSCKNETQKDFKKEPVVFKKEGTLSIFRAQVDTLITKLDIEIADNDFETETGLMYRPQMEEQRGMLFIFPDVAMHSFYMKNTEFPLDILFIKEDLTIGSIQENTIPLDEQGLSSNIPVRYVLEVNAGLVQKLQLQEGDRISFQKN